MSKPSTMSRDRVHFTIPAQYLNKQNIRSCIEETLGIHPTRTLLLGKEDQDLNIVCRPSQFARFIILRHVKYLEPNNMACLDMRLVVPSIPQEFIDVSRNPNEAGGSGENTG